MSYRAKRMRGAAGGATLLLCLWLPACAGDGPDPGTALERGPGSPVDPLDHPPVEVPPASPVSAATKRLSVEQLRQTLPALMGEDKNGNPITWQDAQDPGLDVNAAALGEADYIYITADETSPGPLYVKFMDDAARSVCDQALEADQERPSAEARVLLRHVGFTDTAASKPAEVDENLRYLRLRFHGAWTPGDDATIAPLRTLFTDSVSALAGTSTPTEDQVIAGWRAVCVSLLTAPELHLY
ncbi:MAG: hypothetical protein WKG00_24260 [Polyangiaceae bacterium]